MPQNTVRSILQTPDGYLWLATLDGIVRYDGVRFTVFNKQNTAGLGTNRLVKLIQSPDGDLWVSAESEFIVRRRAGEFSTYKLDKNDAQNNFIKDLVLDDTGSPVVITQANVWAYTTGDAAMIAPDGKISAVTTAHGLSENLTATVFEDRKGSIWVGTLRRGVNRLTRQTIRFYSTEDGLAAAVVHPIYQLASGDILLGGGGFTRFHDGVFSRFDIENPGFAVTAINEDRSGRLWLGDWQNAYYVENGSRKNLPGDFMARMTVTDIHEQKNDALWFATDNGLFRRQNGEMKHLTIADGLIGDTVKVIHESPDETLWFGTYGGLSEYKDGVFTSFTIADGLASNQIRSLYEDADGVLWIGSYDGGLTRFKDGKFTRYTSNDGLFNDGVFQILEDASGNFWMSCNRGIYRVAKQQLNDFADGKINRIESIAYDKSDGLLETECNGGQQPAGIKARDGRLWFPTQGGVAVIDPEKIKANPFAPPVVIETVKIDNEPLENKQTSVEIAPGKNNLEIAYTGLSFVKPEFVKFRYKLAGLDKDWVEAGNRRTAYYSYLPPGNYDFQVIAANSDGVWNTEGATIKIIVQPPFYRAVWFWILSLGIIGGAAFAFYRRRVSKLELEKVAQQAFSRKLLESQERERQRIAANLHDSIGQSLLIIKNRAFLALSDLDEPETVREQLEELSESATGAIEECREISYNLRPYQISRFGLTRTLEAIFKRIAEVTDIETQVKLDDIDDAFSPEAETNIYRVVQESVNNIIKHSGAISAEFVVERRGDAVEIIVRDDGRGFAQNSAAGNEGERGGFGLIGIGERVWMLGGVYEIESEPEKGTSIKIKLTISPINERN